LGKLKGFPQLIALEVRIPNGHNLPLLFFSSYTPFFISESRSN
jgi:hypothetical protein